MDLAEVEMRRSLVEERREKEKLMNEAIRAKKAASKIKLAQEKEFLEQCRVEFLEQVEHRKKKRQEMREYQSLLLFEADKRAQHERIKKEQELQDDKR